MMRQDRTDGEDFLTASRWVQIMCDSTCEGVRDRMGRSCAIDALPVPEVLRRQTFTLQDQFDAL